MAKAPPKAADAGPAILPLPLPLIEHHLRTLGPAMIEWKRQGRVPPVLLLTGAMGIGKREIAWHLAQWILCERNGFARPAHDDDEGGMLDMFGGGEPAPVEPPAAAEPVAKPSVEPVTKPCGECPSCLRALHSSWVDFTEILPEDEGGGLKIDQFRDLKSTMGFGAHQGAYRITLIPGADRMTMQAANSMLKLLEEPPAGWVLFLTASDPTLVLPTVLSRCQQLRLKPFSTADLTELLAFGGVEPKRRAVCAELAQGSWRRAIAAADDEAWTRRQAIFDFIADPAAQAGALVEWGALEPKHFDLLVDQLEHALADLVRWSVSSADVDTHAWLNADAKASLIRHARAAVARFGGEANAREFWIGRAGRVARARGEALAPLNRKLLIQDILLPFLNAKT